MLVRIILTLLIVATSQIAEAQADTLYFKRTFLDTPVYLQNKKLTSREVTNLYDVDKIAARKYKLGRIMLPAAPVLAVSGAALAVDALVGIKRTAVIDGVSYGYTERSLPKLLLGLALVVTGGSFMEGANDFKRTAAQRYNDVIKKAASPPKTTYRSTWGITEAGNVGFRIEF